MNEFNPAIVIPAFKRATSLTRLLKSVDAAMYDEEPRMIISIEGGASADVEAVAYDYKEKHNNATLICK